MCTKVLCGNPKIVMSVIFYSRCELCPQGVVHRARDLRTSPRAKRWLRSGLIRRAKYLFLRDQNVLQQVKVVVLGNLTQREPHHDTLDGRQSVPRAIVREVGIGLRREVGSVEREEPP